MKVLAWCCGLTRWPPKPLYHSPSSTEQGRKNTMKGLWVKMRTGRDYSTITIMGKRDLTWGN